MENTQEKIWGLYTTYKNHELIEQLSEIDIWNMINRLGGAIFWAKHDADRPWGAKVTVGQLIEAQYNIECLVYSTRRFGVEFGREPSATEHVERSESYDAWFSFWDNHFKSMTPQEYNQFVDDKRNGEDISKYMPTGNWKDTLKKHQVKR